MTRWKQGEAAIERMLDTDELDHVPADDDTVQLTGINGNGLFGVHRTTVMGHEAKLGPAAKVAFLAHARLCVCD